MLTTETHLNSCSIVHCCGESELVQQFGKSIWQYISKLRNAKIFLPRNSTSRNSSCRYTYLCAEWHICKASYCSLVCKSKEDNDSKERLTQIHRNWKKWWFPGGGNGMVLFNSRVSVLQDKKVLEIDYTIMWIYLTMPKYILKNG